MANIRLFGFQRQFVRLGLDPGATPQVAPYQFLLAHAGRGSGKSRAGAYRALSYIGRYPGSLGIITAPTYNMLHDASLANLLDVFSEAGLVRNHDYFYTGMREEIIVRRGHKESKILLRTTEHPERLRGPTAAWFWMDEPRDSPFVAFTNLVGTLRQFGFPHQGWMTTTPKGRKHWLYRLFFKRDELFEDAADVDVTAMPAEYHTFNAATEENPFGGQDLAAVLRSQFKGTMMERQEVGGDFVILEGLVYPGWNGATHVVPRDKWPVQRPNRVMAGVDFGYSAPCAIIVEGYDKAGRRYIMDEECKSGLSEQEMIAKAKVLRAEYGIALFSCDDEDPRWIAAMREAHLPAVPAKKGKLGIGNPSGSVALCAAALADPAGFYVDPKCEGFIEEIESYEKATTREDQEQSEKPKKGNDHRMDAWRYSEVMIKRLWARSTSARTIPTGRHLAGRRMQHGR